jgi:hypothetical protein
MIQQNELIYKARGFTQSPDTYDDVTFGNDAHGRSLATLVMDKQISRVQARRIKLNAVNSNSKAGEKHIYYFNKLNDAGMMDFTPFDFNDFATFNLWLDDTFEPFMLDFAVQGASRRNSKDMMQLLTKWMQLHGVNDEALDEMKTFSRSTLWQLLGDDAPMTTKQRKESSRQINDDDMIGILNRLNDLKNNPNARPLYMDELKQGKKAIIGEARILQLLCAFNIGINITARSGEIINLKVSDVQGGQITRLVTKEAASNCGDSITETTWPSTQAAIDEYLASRRSDKQRLPDARLFPVTFATVWRSLMKDYFGEDWTQGMGLHLFSRNEGMKTMIESDATTQELMAATGNTLNSIQPYIEGANLDKQVKSANDIRYKKYSALGLTDAAIDLLADADLENLLNQLQVDASLELSAINGFRSIAPEPALYQCKRDADGNITSKQVWRRERDLNSRNSLSLLNDMMKQLKHDAQGAVDEWMDGNTKPALDLLKVIIGGIE